MRIATSPRTIRWACRCGPTRSPDYAGPLAGFLAGLERCETPYLVTVPCDSPLFPEDLVARLAQGLVDADAEIAMAKTREAGGDQVQPVFCLMKALLMESLVRFTQEGGRKIDRWTGAASMRRSVVR